MKARSAPQAIAGFVACVAVGNRGTAQGGVGDMRGRSTVRRRMRSIVASRAGVRNGNLSVIPLARNPGSSGVAG